MKLELQTKRDLMLLAVALGTATVIALLAWLVLPPARLGGRHAQPSTFFNRPYGTKAAFLVLQKLGYNVRRLRRPIDVDTLAGFDGLVLLRPIYCLNDYETRVLRDWVAAGHNLLVAPTEVPPHGVDCAGPYAWFHFADPNAPAEGTREPGHEAAPVSAPAFAELTAMNDVRFAADGPLVWPAEDLPIRPLWSDEGGLVAFEATYGTGRILALADVYGLTNAGLAEGDHAQWLLALVSRLTRDDPAGHLAFDEYHAGFPHEPDARRAIVQLLWDSRWAWVVTQVLLVGLLALLARGVRFGRPDGVPVARRRTQGEFTRAAGNFLRAARAQDVVLATLGLHYRQRLCRALRVSPQSTAAELAAILEERGHPAWAQSIQPVAVQPAGRPRSLSDAELVRCVQQWHAVVEALEHGVGASGRPRAAHAR